MNELLKVLSCSLPHFIIIIKIIISSSIYSDHQPLKYLLQYLQQCVINKYGSVDVYLRVASSLSLSLRLPPVSDADAPAPAAAGQFLSMYLIISLR